MIFPIRPLHRSLFAAALASAPAWAFAQSNPGYFIPPSSTAAPPPASGGSASHHADRHKSAQPAGQTAIPAGPQPQAEQQLPPIPQLPALPKVTPPPAPVIGVLSVPDVMQHSTAAQGVQQIIQDRRAKLAAEAQKDQQGWQAEQGKIAAQRNKLSDAQLGAKEKSLQDEIAAAQTSFRARDQAIQASAQVALGQIESELIAVIRQEAEAHGMNLVLHREQVALNVNGFDITSDVTKELNQLLPSVSVPPSVVTPSIAAAAANGQDQDQEQDNGQ